ILYIESRCVDHAGRLDDRNLRCNPERHTGHVKHGPWETAYGTRLSDGVVLAAHDDWDCIDDLEAAGLIERHGSAINSVFRLTSEVLCMVVMLRKERQERTTKAR